MADWEAIITKSRYLQAIATVSVSHGVMTLHLFFWGGGGGGGGATRSRTFTLRWTVVDCLTSQLMKAAVHKSFWVFLSPEVCQDTCRGSRSHLWYTTCCTIQSHLVCCKCFHLIESIFEHHSAQDGNDIHLEMPSKAHWIKWNRLHS